MQASEFMLGNICRDALTGEWLRVEEIKHIPGQNHRIGFEVINRYKFPLPDGWYAEAIPINRDIMKRAGFEMHIEDGHVEYRLNLDGEAELVLYARTPYSLPYIPSMPHIKYLHQVQNLSILMANHVLKIDLS